MPQHNYTYDAGAPHESMYLSQMPMQAVTQEFGRTQTQESRRKMQEIYNELKSKTGHVRVHDGANLQMTARFS